MLVTVVAIVVGFSAITIASLMLNHGSGVDNE